MERMRVERRSAEASRLDQLRQDTFTCGSRLQPATERPKQSSSSCLATNLNPEAATRECHTKQRQQQIHTICQIQQQQSTLGQSSLSSRPMRPPLLAFLVCLLSVAQLTCAQCPMNSMTSFERITGVTVKDTTLLSVLYTTAPNMSSLSHLGAVVGADQNRQMAGAAHLNIPITAECNNRCRRNSKCRAFLVDYGRHTCYSIEQTSGGSGGGLLRATPPIQLVPTQERTSYFEKVCLNSAPSDCERAWVYERALAHHLHGEDDKVIEDVSSRLKCQEHCLNEREFRCRSGEYDYLTMQCRLSRIDRHTKPTAFQPTTSNVDYFENQCVPAGHQCSAFDRYEDQDLGRAEIVRSANTSDQCQQICTQIIKAFICRSFTWNPVSGKCYLNSVNTFMVGGIDRLISAPGLIYYQRNDCVDLKLECDTNAMTLSLRTNEPFRGRMYVRDDPNSCETLGRSSLHSSLSIPFNSQAGARCATREMPSRYSSVVVVQQHPLIQRKSDRYIKLVCDFQTSNKTIVSSYNVVANPWTSAALINATSFAPKIRLRITDRSGADITGAKLGDELYLRIEAESDSVYDMTARSVLAKSGNTEESIALIDKDGCPTDFRIFPPLKRLNRRTIIGKFDAFKFSSDVVVRFQVDVQFCLNQCPPSSCEHNLLMNAAGNAQLNPENVYLNEITTVSNGPESLGSSSTQPPETLTYPRNSAGELNRQQLGGQHHPRPPSNFTGQPHYLDSFPLAADQPGFYGAPPQRVNMGSGSRSPIAAAVADLANFTSNQHQQILDSLTHSAGGDPQMFDHSRAAPLPANVPHGAKLVDPSGKGQRPKVQPHPHSPVQGNSIAEPANPAGSLEAAPSDLSFESAALSARRRRRRRDTSGEPQVPATRHVPLQREIIVESSPPTRPAASGSNKLSSQQQQQRKQQQRSSFKADGLSGRQNGPTYDLNDQHRVQSNSEEQQDNGTLLCTTRHSLVLASVAFCVVQFITVALCLVTWMHKKDVKFKVKHPIEERLY